MDIVFPCNPTPGQQFQQWQWDGEKWVAIGTTGWAPIVSPNFQGIPTAPTAAPGTSTSQLATTAFVMAAITSHIAGVASWNNRTGNVVLMLQDILDAGGAPLDSPQFTGTPTGPNPPPYDVSQRLATTSWVSFRLDEIRDTSVWSWNGRTGDVVLTLGDITNAGGAPIASPEFTGHPNAPTPPPDSHDTSIATTAWVFARLCDLRADFAELISHTVITFNGRHGNVTLLANDISAVGGALLWSPHFVGVPTAPTPPAGDASDRIATTEFVRSAIEKNLPERGPPGLQGPAGPPGPGFQLLPSVEHVHELPLTGNQPGDVRIVEDSGIGYVWEVPPGHWSAIGFMTGRQGPPGPEGPEGDRGPPGHGLVARGSVPTVGDLPTHGQHVGDYWTVDATGHGYAWDGDAWVDIGMIRGPAGAAASIYVNADPPAAPETGTEWLDTSAELLKIWVVDKWIPFDGPRGKYVWFDYQLTAVDRLVSVSGYESPVTLTLYEDVPVGTTIRINWFFAGTNPVTITATIGGDPGIGWSDGRGELVYAGAVVVPYNSGLWEFERNANFWMLKPSGGVFNTTFNGLVPKSPGGAANFLRSDGAWTNLLTSPVAGADIIKISSPDGGLNIQPAALVSSTSDFAIYSAGRVYLRPSGVPGFIFPDPVAGSNAANFLRADGKWAPVVGVATFEGSDFVIPVDQSIVSGWLGAPGATWTLPDVYAVPMGWTVTVLCIVDQTAPLTVASSTGAGIQIGSAIVPSVNSGQALNLLYWTFTAYPVPGNGRWVFNDLTFSSSIPGARMANAGQLTDFQIPSDVDSVQSSGVNAAATYTLPSTSSVYPGKSIVVSVINNSSLTVQPAAADGSYIVRVSTGAGGNVTSASVWIFWRFTLTNNRWMLEGTP
jgi:hypothetical protein